MLVEINYEWYGSHDCVSCKQHWLSGLAELSAATMPWVSSIVGAVQGRKMYQAAMDVTQHGMDLCHADRQYYLNYAQTQQDAYVQYNVDQQGPHLRPEDYGNMTISPEMFSGINCNGYNIGAFAGFGSWGGGFSPWAGNGYSQGWMNGMMGLGECIILMV